MFEEIQLVRRMTWYWVISIPLFLLGGWGLINLVDVPDDLHIHNQLHVFSALPIILSCLFFFVRLKTTYTDTEIMILFSPIPFFKKRINWNQISKVYVRKFKWSEFKATGLGAIPLGVSGNAYHLFGEYGLQIETTDGNKILIGTRKPKSLQEFLRRIKKM